MELLMNNFNKPPRGSLFLKEKVEKFVKICDGIRFDKFFNLRRKLNFSVEVLS